MTPLDSTRTISGGFGEVWQDGKWLTNFYEAEVKADVSYDKIKRAGTRKVGNKVGGIEISGSITGYKVTSELVKAAGQVVGDRNEPFVTELIFKLDDPQSYGTERIRVKGVQFTSIPFMNFSHGEVVTQELPFVAEDVEYLSEITEN